MALPPDFVPRLREIVGEEAILTDPSDCWAYGYDNSRRQLAPLAVAFPTTHEQVRDIVRLARKETVPLVPRGRGTGTTGGSIPVNKSVALSLERMDQILEVDPGNRLMRVQPGVINQTVQAAAAEHGLFWAPDPGSSAFCTVGGNLAFNAAGPRAVKYGTTRENTLGLRAVTGSGESIRTGVMTTKGVVGYDLTRLLIGSEGTLAVITEAVLKLLPFPSAKRTIKAVYKDIEHATEAIVSVMKQPALPCALEFMDQASIDMIRAYSKADLPQHAGALLMLEIDGDESCLDQSAQSVLNALINPGQLSVDLAHSEAEAKELWSTRKALSPALRKIAPNKLNEDVVVPVTRMPDLLRQIQKLSKHYKIPIVNFGHAGNGNIHVNLLYDARDSTQNKNAHECLRELFTLVLELGGTLSGEHGVGTEKQGFISEEIEPATLELMRGIKREFDPDNILNPGKMFPASG